MCGRYELHLTESARANRYAYERWLDSLFDDSWTSYQTHDARPETLRPVVAAASAPALERMRWGWHPSWMRAPLINARFETVPTKGTFKRAFAERRCVIPATGYFEWLRDDKDKPKAKYLFRGQGGTLLRMAGLWEDSIYKEVRERRFLVLTRAMVLHAHVHDRTPVLLSPAAAEVWLDPTAQEAELLDAATHLGDDHLALRSVTFDKIAGKTDGPHLSEPLDGAWPWESASL